jgi:hypothetical protein
VQSSRAHGVKAKLVRSGRTVTTGTVRVSGGRVQLRLGGRVRPGRYDLILVRGNRQVARQAVMVTG